MNNSDTKPAPDEEYVFEENPGKVKRKSPEKVQPSPLSAEVTELQKCRALGETSSCSNGYCILVQQFLNEVVENVHFIKTTTEEGKQLLRGLASYCNKLQLLLMECHSKGKIGAVMYIYCGIVLFCPQKICLEYLE